MCLLALAPMHIAYSQEARPYALEFLLVCVSIALLARALRLGEIRAWAGFTLASVLGLYTQYQMAMVLAVLGLSLAAFISYGQLARSEVSDGGAHLIIRSLPFLIALALVGLAFLPWYIYATGYQAQVAFHFPAPSVLDVPRYDEAILGVFTISPIGGTAPPATILLARVVESLALIGLVAGRPMKNFGVLALGAMIVLLPGMVFLVDARSGYFFDERQLLLLLIPLFVLAMIGARTVVKFAARLSRALEGRAPLVVGVVIVAWLALSLPALAIGYTDRITKEDWRGLASRVTASICPSARLWVNLSASYSFGVGYYAPKLLAQARYLPLPAAAFGTSAQESNLLARYGIGRPDWIVIRPLADWRQMIVLGRYFQMHGYIVGTEGFFIVAAPSTSQC